MSKESEGTNVSLNGVFDASRNSIPSAVGVVGHGISGATAVAADQTVRVHGIIGTTANTLATSLFDQSGNAYGASNPLFVGQGSSIIVTANQGGNWFVGQSGPFNVGQTGNWFVGQSGPFNVGQTGTWLVGQSGNWFVGQSGPFNVGQTGYWTVGQTNLWYVGQSGAWLVGQSGNWYVGQSGPFDVGQTGAWYVGQSGSWWVGQTNNWFVGQSGPFNVGQTGAWFVGQSGSWFVGQTNNWFVGQSGPFNVGQTGSWFVGQSGSWFVGQTNNWFVGQSGPFDVGQTGNWFVGQSGVWLSRTLDGVGNTLTSTSYDGKRALDVQVSVLGANTATHIFSTPTANISTQLLAANSSRKWAIFSNNSGGNFFLKYGTTAVVNQGIPVASNGGIYIMDGTQLFLGVVNGIVASSNRTIEVIEGF